MVTITTVAIDADLLADLVRWRYGPRLAARADAADLLRWRYPEPAWTVRLGEDRVGMIAPHVDEMVALSAEDAFIIRFYRLLAGLSALLDALLPCLRPAPDRSLITRPVGHANEARDAGVSGRRLRPEAVAIDEAFRAELSHRWLLAELAQLVHLSPSQVRRVMIASYGRTPLAHLNRLRAEAVARSLRTEDVTFIAAYRDVGWSNRGHAARVFTQVIGITPQQYAAHHRQRD